MGPGRWRLLDLLLAPCGAACAWRSNNLLNNRRSIRSGLEAFCRLATVRRSAIETGRPERSTDARDQRHRIRRAHFPWMGRGTVDGITDTGRDYDRPCSRLNWKLALCRCCRIPASIVSASWVTKRVHGDYHDIRNRCQSDAYLQDALSASKRRLALAPAWYYERSRFDQPAG